MELSQIMLLPVSNGPDAAAPSCGDNATAVGFSNALTEALHPEEKAAGDPTDTALMAAQLGQQTAAVCSASATVVQSPQQMEGLIPDMAQPQMQTPAQTPLVQPASSPIVGAANPRTPEVFVSRGVNSVNTEQTSSTTKAPVRSSVALGDTATTTASGKAATEARASQVPNAVRLLGLDAALAERGVDVGLRDVTVLRLSVDSARSAFQSSAAGGSDSRALGAAQVATASRPVTSSPATPPDGLSAPAVVNTDQGGAVRASWITQVAQSVGDAPDIGARPVDGQTQVAVQPTASFDARIQDPVLSTHPDGPTANSVPVATQAAGATSNTSSGEPVRLDSPTLASTNQSAAHVRASASSAVQSQPEMAVSRREIGPISMSVDELRKSVLENRPKVRVANDASRMGPVDLRAAQPDGAEVVGLDHPNASGISRQPANDGESPAVRPTTQSTTGTMSSSTDPQSVRPDVSWTTDGWSTDGGRDMKTVAGTIAHKVVGSNEATGKASSDAVQPSSASISRAEANAAVARHDAATVAPAFLQDTQAATAARQVVTPESSQQGDVSVATTVTRSVVGRVQTLAANPAGGTAVVQLYPPELGHLRLSVHVDGSSVEVNAITPNIAVRDILQSGMNELRSGLEQMGMKCESFQVQVDAQHAGGYHGQAGQTADHGHQAGYSAYRTASPTYQDSRAVAGDGSLDMSGIRLDWRRSAGMSRMLDTAA